MAASPPDPTLSLRAVLTRASSGEQIEISHDATAGRLGQSDVKLTDGSASRTHAKFAFRDGALWLEDLQSAYGTFVNDARIAQPVRLNTGDRLRFGLEDFVIAVPPPGSPGEGATAIAKAAAPPVARAPAAAVAVVAPAAATAIAPIAAAPVAEAKAGPTLLDDGGAKKRPGAWADSWGPRAENKSTRYIPPDEMKEMIANPGAPAAAAPDIDVPHVQIVTGDRASVVVPLRAGDTRVTEWSIGSHADREVVVPDHGVSALHARIANDGKRWKLVDQMSANGTFVNGKRSSVSYLASGDRLRFGPVECIFWMPIGSAGSAGGSKLRWPVVALALVGVLAAAAFVYFRMTR
jgi:pSer/pThr/pTyr-binding forkhead associated (FHA) protein